MEGPVGGANAVGGGYCYGEGELVGRVVEAVAPVGFLGPTGTAMNKRHNLDRQ